MMLAWLRDFSQSAQKARENAQIGQLKSQPLGTHLTRGLLINAGRLITVRLSVWPITLMKLKIRYSINTELAL